MELCAAKVFHEEVVEEGVKLSATVVELGNSYIILLCEGESENLGTLSVSLPAKIGTSISRPPLSSVLLGERSAILARLIAERVAALTNKIALVSVFLKTLNEQKTGQVFIRLLEKILKEKIGGART